MEIKVKILLEKNWYFLCWWEIIAQFLAIKIAVFRFKKKKKDVLEFVFGEKYKLQIAIHWSYHFVELIMENMNIFILI